MDSDRADRRKDAEGLPQFPVQLASPNLLLQYGVGSAKYVESLAVDFPADDPNSEPRSRKRLAPDHRVGQAEFSADGANLILEEHPQWLDQFELKVVGQSADIVVRLDRRRMIATTGLDHIRIQGALNQIVDIRQLEGLFLENANEL